MQDHFPTTLRSWNLLSPRKKTSRTAVLWRSQTLLRGSGRRGSSLSRETQTSLSPATSSSSSGGTLRRSQASRETLCLYKHQLVHKRCDNGHLLLTRRGVFNCKTLTLTSLLFCFTSNAAWTISLLQIRSVCFPRTSCG